MTTPFNKSYAFFKSVFGKMISHGIIACDMTDKIIYVNKAGESFINAGFDDLKDRKITDLIENQFINQLLSKFFLFKKDYQHIMFEFNLEKDGQTNHYSVWIIPFIDDKTYSGCIVTIEDITERKENEIIIKKENEKLNELLSIHNNKYKNVNRQLIEHIDKLKSTTLDLIKAETSYQLIFDQSILGMYRLGMDGTIQEMNDAFRMLMDYPKKTDNFLPFIKDGQFFKEKEDHGIFWNLLKKNGKIFEYETQFISSHKKDIHVSLHASIVTPIHGNPFALVIAEDITYKKFSENMLFEYYDLIQTILDKIPNPIFYKNINGQYRGCNEAFCKVTGLKKNDIIGKSLKQFAPSEVSQVNLKKDKELIETGKSVSYQARFLNYKHQEIQVIVSKALYYSKEGKAAGIVGSLTNIEEIRKKEERMINDIKNKELLLKETHHRVKNNFNMIFNLLQLEEMNIKDPEVLSILRDIQSRVKTMSSLHRKFYESGTDGFINSDEYLKQLCDELLSSYTNKSVLSHIYSDKIKFNIDTVVPFGLIITELITNSIKHGFSDSLNGEISIQLYSMDDNKAALIYEDNGKGLKPGFKLFETKTLGTRLIAGLINQLQGKLTLIREKPFTMKIHFQYKAS